MVRSTIPSDVIHQEKEHLIGVLNSKRMEPEYQMKEMFMRAIYSESPYTKSLEERVTALQAITPEDVNAFHEQLLTQTPRVTVT